MTKSTNADPFEVIRARAQAMLDAHEGAPPASVVAIRRRLNDALAEASGALLSLAAELNAHANRAKRKADEAARAKQAELDLKKKEHVEKIARAHRAEVERQKLLAEAAQLGLGTEIEVAESVTS